MRDRNGETARIADAITRVGPDLQEVARRVHISVGTVRYRYKTQILGKGLPVEAQLDYERLGMRSLLAVVRMDRRLAPHADSVMGWMNATCYLTDHWLVTPTGERLLQLLVPDRLQRQVASLFEDLKALGIFSHADLTSFDSLRMAPMMTRYFDFDEGSWSYDWSASLPGRAASPPPHGRAGRADYDALDLRILRELSQDANASLAGIAASLGMSYRMLQGHNSKHVLRRGLVRSYGIRWMGSRRHDPRRGGMVVGPRQGYVPLFVLVRDATRAEKLEVSAMLNRVPFLWHEAFGTDYWASMYVPVGHYTESLNYLRGFIQEAPERARLYTADPAGSLSLPFPSQLFDREEKEWQLDPAVVLTEMENLVLRTRVGGAK